MLSALVHSVRGGMLCSYRPLEPALGRSYQDRRIPRAPLAPAEPCDARAYSEAVRCAAGRARQPHQGVVTIWSNRYGVVLIGFENDVELNNLQSSAISHLATDPIAGRTIVYRPEPRHAVKNRRCPQQEHATRCRALALHFLRDRHIFVGAGDQPDTSTERQIRPEPVHHRRYAIAQTDQKSDV
jgi:hypothetical protein